MDINEIKRIVAYEAVNCYVTSGLSIGLGTGSTAFHVIDCIGQKLKKEELVDIVCVATSEASQKHAQSLGIPLCSLDTIESLDVYIDGADEVDSHLNLIKGKGAALLREKMVAKSAKMRVIVVDESKLIRSPDTLGAPGPLPVEIVKFSALYTVRQLMKIGDVRNCELRLDENQRPIETDNNNYIADLYFTKAINDHQNLHNELNNTTGVIENGLFLGVADVCLVGKSDGSIETIMKAKRPN